MEIKMKLSIALSALLVAGSMAADESGRSGRPHRSALTAADELSASRIARC